MSSSLPNWTTYPQVGIPERTYRLIPKRFPPVSAFETVAAPEDLDAIMELEGWTNDRLVAERAARIPPNERAYGRPNTSVVMASFLHASPAGGRFNGPELGAWYASMNERTAIAEVAAGLRREARRAGFEGLEGTYRAYAADLDGDRYVDVRGQAEERSDLYDRGDWRAGQAFGEAVRAGGGDGVAYDSVRLRGGVNVVGYRPSQVVNVAIAATFDIVVPFAGQIQASRLE